MLDLGKYDCVLSQIGIKWKYRKMWPIDKIKCKLLY